MDNQELPPERYTANMHFALCEIRRLRRINKAITQDASSVQEVISSQLELLQAKNAAIRAAISSIHDADLAAALDTLYACLPEGNDYQP